MRNVSPNACCHPTIFCSRSWASLRTLTGRSALLLPGAYSKELQAMDYRQNTDGCLAGTVGQRGLDHETLDAMLARTAPALDKLRRIRDDGSLPLLGLPNRKDDIAQLR